MASHITPLTRNQLLDLEGLVLSVVDTLRPPQAGSPAGSPRALHRTRDSPGSLQQQRDCPSPGSSSSRRDDGGIEEKDHPALHGNFFDVFEDMYTAHTWRLYDKMLYVVWWSYRPPSCATCGSQDAWIPCPNSEMQCAQCGAEAGSTRLNDIVEDLPGGGENQEDGNDSADDELFGGGDGLLGGDGTGGEGGAAAIALYMYFYERLQCVVQMQSSVQVAVPTGEALPTVLRAAFDMAGLLVLPGMSSAAASVVQAASLYVSLALHRYAVPFPLFQVATRASNASVAHLHSPHGHASSPASSSSPRMPSLEDPVALHVTTEKELLWVDVELVAAMMGVSLADFFESPQVAAQYLQNVLTVAASYNVPSILWHPSRVPARMESILALKAKRKPMGYGSSVATLTQHTATAGLSPEHTAMLVAIELARRVDEEPMVSSSTSNAAAIQNAARLGKWLDGLGLYPTRHVYRSESFFGEDKAAFEASVKTLAAVNDLHIVPMEKSSLTTESAMFSDVMECILPSPCANAMLHVLARTFRMPPLELAELATRSGIYQGSTRFFNVLQHSATQGAYHVIPLLRRLSPVCSYWTSAYLALHSNDRLPFLAALHQLNDTANNTRDKLSALARLLQRILRKHQAAHLYQLNYVLHVADDTEKHFNGLYFLSGVHMDGSLAVYTCLRSGRKTITFNAHTKTISLCFVNAKERIVTNQLRVQFKGPVVATLESESAKAVMDSVVGGGILSSDAWSHVVRRLDRCGRVRRRMRVPMLASRLDALASIREVSTLARHPIAGAATLLGWGQTESVFASPPPVDVFRMRYELHLNLFSLPSASLIHGLSENRVVAMYASLVALLEFIQANTAAAGRVDDAGRVLMHTWIEELLADDDHAAPSNTATPLYGRVSPLAMPQGGGTSPPHVTPPIRAVMTPVMGPSASSGGVHIAPHASTPPLPPLDLPMDMNTFQQRGSPSTSYHKKNPSSGRSQYSDKQQLIRSYMRIGLPDYWEVLLGTATGKNLASSATTPAVDSAASMDDLQSHHHRRMHRSSHTRRRVGGGGGAEHAARGEANAASASTPALVTESLVSRSVFNLFSAEECRKRLVRIFAFAAAYRAKVDELNTLADAKSLPPLPSTIAGNNNNNTNTNKIKSSSAFTAVHTTTNRHETLATTAAAGGGSGRLSSQQQPAVTTPPMRPRQSPTHGSRGHSPPIRDSPPLTRIRKSSSPIIASQQQQGRGTEATAEVPDFALLPPPMMESAFTAAPVAVDDSKVTGSQVTTREKQKKSGRRRRRLENRQLKATQNHPGGGDSSSSSGSSSDDDHDEPSKAANKKQNVSPTSRMGGTSATRTSGRLNADNEEEVATNGAAAALDASEGEERVMPPRRQTAAATRMSNAQRRRRMRSVSTSSSDS